MTLSGEKNVRDEESVVVNALIEPPSSKPVPSEPGDGGAFAWLQACGGFVLMFNSWGLVNTFGAFQAYYQTVLLQDQTASQISWIGSLQAFLLLFGGMATGPLFDKGYLKSLVLLGSFLIVFGMMMTSLCTQYWQVMLSQGVVVGLGYGFFMVPSVAVVPQYFKKRRALALGVVATGGSLGGIIYTIMFQRLVPRIGFGWATRIIAFVALTMSLVPILGMKWNGNPNKPPMKLVAAAWKDIPFMIYVLAAFFGFIGLYIPFFYIELYAISKGIASQNLIPYLLPLLSAGSLLGRLAGPLNIAVFCTLGAGITAFSWIAVSTEAGLVIFCCFFGFFSGAFLALGAAIVPSLAPDLRLLGLRMAILFLPASIGVLIGNPIAGALSRSGWLPLQAFCAALMVASSLFMAVSRLSARGLQLRSKV